MTTPTRLTKVQRGGSDSETYGYDANGNRTSRTGPGVSGTETATYDGQGRLATRGGIAYSFDGAGYLTQRGADTFTYGPLGRLQSANVGGSAITYAYDTAGRRTARTEGGNTEQYLYGNPDNPWELSASRAAAGQLAQYFYDPYGRLVGFDRGGARFYVFTDAFGSPRLVTNAAGAAVKRIDYDAYGDVISDSAPAFSLPVGFDGGLADPSSGLVLFGKRDYEPASGRWTARDPILFDGGQTNLYAFVGDDPTDVRDPDGLQWANNGNWQQNTEDIAKKLAKKELTNIIKKEKLPEIPKKGDSKSEYKFVVEEAVKNEKQVTGFFDRVSKAYDAACKSLQGE